MNEPFLDKDLYIDKKVKLLAFEHTEETGSREYKKTKDWLELFEDLSRHDNIDLDRLNKLALEKFISTFGVIPDVKDEEETVSIFDPEIITNIIDIKIDGDIKVPIEEKLFNDFEFFCRKCVQIPYRQGFGEHTIGKRAGPLILSTAQKKAVTLIIDIFFNKKLPLRAQVLKARQLGLTILFLIFLLWVAFQISSFTIMFIIDKGVHLNEKRQLLIDVIKRASSLSTQIPGIKRLGHKVIELTNFSRLLFESSMSENIGTSEMIHALHMSERPKWKAGAYQQVKASVMPALPETEFTIMFDESTAEGEDSFKEDWDRLHEEGVFDGIDVPVIPLFFPWYISREYRKKPTVSCFNPGGEFIYLNDDKELAELDSEGEILLNEEEYAEKYNLDNEQIYWRRTKIKNAFKGDKVLFDQEYPTTPEHAWAAIGNTFYPKFLLNSIECKDPVFIGDIYDERIEKESITRLPSFSEFNPKLRHDSTGMLRIYRFPADKEEKFFIGGDVAEGKVAETSSGFDYDYCTISVIDAYGRDAAFWRGHIKPEELPYYLVLIGKFFNLARINCERNKDGATTWAFFWPTGYPNIYYRKTKGNMSDNAWVLITPGMRKPVMNLLRAVVMEDPKRILDRQTYAEMTKFIRKPNGKVESMSGWHDDCLFARAHAEISRKGYEGWGKIKPEEKVKEEEFPTNSLGDLFQLNGIRS